LIRQKLAEGWTEEQINDLFVQQYGERVLAVPPRRDSTGCSMCSRGDFSGWTGNCHPDAAKKPEIRTGCHSACRTGKRSLHSKNGETLRQHGE
jgi:hypothetical protein